MSRPHVAVAEAGGVHGGQRLGQQRPEGADRAGRQRAVGGDGLVERGSRDVGVGGPDGAARGVGGGDGDQPAGAYVPGGGDIGLEAGAEGRVEGVGGADQLERDRLAAQGAGEIDHAAAALP
ncbi:hypothetical protein GCM10022227_55550 [Streptomyces sedi]